MQYKLSFPTLLLMISFASVNAVLFTPALPSIVNFFQISDSSGQLTITWFLVGYAIGQLIYGPIANRYGRKPALYIGISIQIASSLLCAFSSALDNYMILVLGRFLLALGSGVGLKMTFTLVNECYEPKMVSKKISYLMLAFAITPGIGVAIGGVLISHFNWTSCFYVGALYGVILLLMTFRLPETLPEPDKNAFKLDHMLHAYSAQFTNRRLVLGALLLASSTSFFYAFAAVGPFVAMNLLGMDSVQYGMSNLLPPVGLILGLLSAARVAHRYTLERLILAGITITSIGAILMLILTLLQASALMSLFFPVAIIYFGLSFVMSNASTMAMSGVQDKAHGSAVMSFINMGTTTLVVLCLGFFKVGFLLLPFIYMLLCCGMFVLLRLK